MRSEERKSEETGVGLSLVSDTSVPVEIESLDLVRNGGVSYLNYGVCRATVISLSSLPGGVIMVEERSSMICREEELWCSMISLAQKQSVLAFCS